MDLVRHTIPLELPPWYVRFWRWMFPTDEMRAVDSMAKEIRMGGS